MSSHFMFIVVLCISMGLSRSEQLFFASLLVKIPFTGLCKWQASEAIFHVVAKVTGWIKEVFIAACALSTTCLYDCHWMIIWGCPNGSKPLERAELYNLFKQPTNWRRRSITEGVRIMRIMIMQKDKRFLKAVKNLSAQRPASDSFLHQDNLILLSILYFLKSSCYAFDTRKFVICLTIETQAIIYQHCKSCPLFFLYSLAPFWKCLWVFVG